MTIPAAPDAACSVASRRRAAGDEYDASRLLRCLQRAPGGELTEHPGDRLVVLSSKHLGWRQQGSLATCINHCQHRAQCDQRFA
jgi:hypothetical protein